VQSVSSVHCCLHAAAAAVAELWSIVTVVPRALVVFLFFLAWQQPFFSIHVGVAVGAAVGEAVGVAVGEAVGVAVGTAVGEAVGGAVGAAVGVAVGAEVGATVGATYSVFTMHSAFLHDLVDRVVDEIWLLLWNSHLAVFFLLIVDTSIAVHSSSR